MLVPLADEYDLVVLDCPPSISLVSENVFLAADALVVPLIPTTLSLRTLDQLTGFVRENGLKHLRLLPFFSMADRRKALHREVVATLHEAHPEILATQIPSATEVERMGVHRGPVASFAPASRIARAYEALWDEVRAALDP